MNAAGSSVILSGTFFYGGIVQLIAGFFALAAGATFAAAFLTAYGAFWLGYTAIEVWVAPHIVATVMGSPASKAGAPRSPWQAQAGHDVAPGARGLPDRLARGDGDLHGGEPRAPTR